MAGSGWCHHPQRKTTSDLMIMVRSNELACRNQWADDLWQSATADDPPGFTDRSVVSPHSVARLPPATERDIAAVLKASSEEEKASEANNVVTEDVVLSAGGLRIDLGLHVAEPERTPASQEQTPRSAIIRAHESARERRRREEERAYNLSVPRFNSTSNSDPMSSEDEALGHGAGHVSGSQREGVDAAPESGVTLDPLRVPPVAPSSPSEERFDTIPERMAAFDLPLRGQDTSDERADPLADQHDALTSSELRALLGEEGAVAHVRQEVAPRSIGTAADEVETGQVTEARDLSVDTGRGRLQGRQAPRVDLVRESPFPRDVASAELRRDWDPPTIINEFNERNHEGVEGQAIAETTELPDDGSDDRVDARSGYNDHVAFERELVDDVSDLEEAGELTDQWQGDVFSRDSEASTGTEDAFDDERRTNDGEDLAAANRLGADTHHYSDDVDNEVALADMLTPQADEAQSQMTVSLAPELPRQCRTCRDFRPAEGGERGWCANEWAFTHRRMVSGTDLMPCATTLGSWWLPVDEVWAAKADVSAHGQPTPLMDALLEHLGLLEWGREAPMRERRRS